MPSTRSKRGAKGGRLSRRLKIDEKLAQTRKLPAVGPQKNSADEERRGRLEVSQNGEKGDEPKRTGLSLEKRRNLRRVPEPLKCVKERKSIQSQLRTTRAHPQEKKIVLFYRKKQLRESLTLERYYNRLR